jgi:hypothetical protein
MYRDNGVVTVRDIPQMVKKVRNLLENDKLLRGLSANGKLFIQQKVRHLLYTSDYYCLLLTSDDLDGRHRTSLSSSK